MSLYDYGCVTGLVVFLVGCVTSSVTIWMTVAGWLGG